MELTGKVIIFESEDEAKMWYEAIKDSKRYAEIQSAKLEFESWKEDQERFKNEEEAIKESPNFHKNSKWTE